MLADCAVGGIGAGGGGRAALAPAALAAATFTPSRAGLAGRQTSPAAMGAAGSEKRDLLGWCTAERLRMQEMQSAGDGTERATGSDDVAVEADTQTPQLGHAYLFGDPEPSPSAEPAPSRQASAPFGMGARGWTERSARKGERSNSRR